MVVVLGALVLLMYGGARISAAGLDIFPEFSPRLVVVQTEAPGYAAEQVEVLVTAPIERSLRGLIGLDHVRSESIQGLSIVTAVFDDGTDNYTNRAQVNERLAAVRDLLPTGVVDPAPVPLSSSSATVRTVGVRAPGLDPMTLRQVVETTLVPRFMAVRGVADVNVFGGAERALQVNPKLETLARLGIGLDVLMAAVRQATTRAGAGFFEGPNQRFTLVTDAASLDADALKQTVVRADARGVITLKDVAEVGYAALPGFSAAQIAGEPGVIMMIIGQLGANTYTVSGRLERVLEALEPVLAAQGVELFPSLFVPANYIERSLRDITSHLAIGASMVLVVLFLGLYNVRTALISAVAIPLSITSALLVLIEFGVNLNVMVLAGLAIALGEVVDDAVIDTENIFRRLRQRQSGEDAREVVVGASLEVRSSVVYATFIVALVFVPLLTLGGVSGRLFGPLGSAYILAVLASLLVAVTVTPALCMLLLTRTRLRASEAPFFKRINPWFEGALAGLMRSARMTILGTVAVSLVIAGFVPLFGERFLPELREGHYILHTTGLPGTSIEESIRVGTRLTDAVAEIDGVTSVSQWAGRAERGADTYGSHYSEYDIALAPLSGPQQQAVLDQIIDILAALPGVTFEANTFLTERVDETISGYSAPVVINIFGDDLDALDRVAAEVAAVARTLPEARGVRLRSVHGRPVFEVQFDGVALARYGLSAGAVRSALEALFGGAEVGEVIEDGRTWPVVVLAPGSARIDPDMLASVPLSTAEGVTVPLSAIARVEAQSGRYNIVHRDAQRLQVVTMRVAGGDVAGFVKTLKAAVSQQVELPPGVMAEYTGAASEQADARNQLILDSLVAGSAVLLLILMAVGSARHVGLILLNLPFSFVGGVIAVAAGGGVISIGSVVGFVTLFGITVRNSIMLVSHYAHLVEIDGRPWNLETAVLGARERLPAILMTALVTALAMLPLTVNSDNPGREIMGPMAGIIIGGLASSTLLNLFVMPVVFARYGRFGTGRPTARSNPESP